MGPPETARDKKWRIQVVARLKPVPPEETAVVTMVDATTLSVPREDLGFDESTTASFTMDRVVGPEASQADVYALFRPLVSATCRGSNAM